MDLSIPLAAASSGVTDTGITDAGKAIALGALTFPMAFAFFIFELGLIATLQAFIFSILTAIYIGGATAESH